MKKNTVIKGYKKEICDEDITLGGDPEFELVTDDGRGHNLEEYVTHRGRSATVYTHADNADIFSYESRSPRRIGTDCENIELRPLQHHRPEVFAANYAKLVKRIHRKGMKLSVKGDTNPIGGHIHIGLDKDTRALLNKMYDYVVPRTKSDVDQYRILMDTLPRLVHLLDLLFAQKICSLNGIHRGRGRHYGKLGDFHTHKHGIEYRVPPATIYQNRTVLTLVLKMVKGAVKAWYENDTIEVPKVITNKWMVEHLHMTKEDCEALTNEIHKLQRKMKKAGKPLIVEV